MSLKTKLLTTFLVAILLILIIGTINIYFMRSTTQKFSQLTEQNAPALIALGLIKSAATRIREETISAILLVDESQDIPAGIDQLAEEIDEEIEEIQTAKENFDLEIDRYTKLTINSPREDLIAEIKQHGDNMFETSNAMLALKENGVTGEAIIDLKEKLENDEGRLDSLINRATNLEVAAFEANRAEADSRANFTYVSNVISIVVGGGLVILITIIVTRSVTAPVAKLKNAAEEIGHGHLDTKVSINSGDEFEFLAHAFNQMALDLSQTTVSKTYLDNIINSIGDALIILSPDQTIQRVNQSTLDLLHYDEQELIGSPATLIFAEHSIVDLLAKEKTQGIETTYLTKSGQEITVLFSSTQLDTVDEQSQGVVCVALDISERKQMEEALRNNEAQLSEAQRVAKLGYWRRNLNTNQIVWSDQTRAMYDVSPQAEITLDVIFSKIHPDDLDRVQPIVQSAIDGNATSYNFEHRVMRQDGIGYLNTIGNIVRDENGRAIATYGTLQDVTHRKQAEIALQRSNEQLTTMYEITQLVSSTLDLDKLLDSIAQSTADLLKCDACTIRLLDGQILNIVGAYGISQQMTSQVRQNKDQFNACQIALFNQPVIVADLQNDPNFSNPAAIDEGLLSCASVPLKIDQKTIGTLDVHSKASKNAFAADDLQLLEKLASQAAIAIANARLFEDEQQQRQLAESLRAVATALNTSLDQQTLLDEIFTQLKRVLDYDGAGIFLKEQENLVLIADTEATDNFVGFNLSLTSNDPAVRVFNEQSTLNVPDVYADPGWEVWEGGEHIRGWMGSPLIANKQPIGVITADSLEVNTFQTEDSHILQAFASQAAVAINNANLFQREQHQRQIAESLQEISAVINSSLNQNYVINKIFKELQNVIAYDSAAIFLLENNMLELKDGRNLPERVIGNRIPLTSKNPTLEPFITHQPRVISDVYQYPHWYNRIWKDSEKIRCWMGAPLLVNGEALGVLTLDNFTLNYYSEHDGQLLQLFANQAAIAIQNAKLYTVAQHEIMEQERITRDLEQARDQALKASQLKTELLAKVSHELRTPLGAILGYTELLQNGSFGSISDEQSKITQEVIDSTQYLADMVNELLDQAQLESGKIQINIGSFTAYELIEPIVSKMNILANTKGLELKIDIDPKIPTNLFGDKKRLQQILVNLISNAIKFTNMGQVQVRLYPITIDQWAIQVSDTGPGIPDEAQNYIFEPFRQVDGSTTRQHRGTGLGLSIVKQMVGLMGGEIDLISQVNQGSTFTVTLPFIPIEEKIL